MTLTTKELRPDYHARIMNVRPSGTVATPDTFVCGYRDARHDAAEIATQADAEISALRAEVERLRTALSAIEDAENYIRGDWFELADWYRRHARFTLSEGNK